MRYKVTATGKSHGVAYVDADDLEKAEERVRELREVDYDWDLVDNMSVERVEQEGGDHLVRAAEPQSPAEPEPQPVPPVPPPVAEAEDEDIHHDDDTIPFDAEEEEDHPHKPKHKAKSKKKK